MALLAAMVPALAADFSVLDDRTLAGNSRYDRCLSLTQRNASLALGTAVAWQGNGGDGAATHCAALALVALRRYPEAAARLDQLGHENIGSAAGRAAVFDQAGNAWLLRRCSAIGSRRKPISPRRCRAMPRAPISWCCALRRAMRSAASRRPLPISTRLYASCPTMLKLWSSGAR